MRLNFRLTVTFLANIYEPIDRGIWLYMYYNFAAGSFHTKKHCNRLYSTEVDLYFKKMKKSLFEPPFGDFGAAYALHV